MQHQRIARGKIAHIQARTFCIEVINSDLMYKTAVVEHVVRNQSSQLVGTSLNEEAADCAVYIIETRTRDRDQRCLVAARTGNAGVLSRGLMSADGARRI